MFDAGVKSVAGNVVEFRDTVSAVLDRDFLPARRSHPQLLVAQPRLPRQFLARVCRPNVLHPLQVRVGEEVRDTLGRLGIAQNEAKVDEEVNATPKKDERVFAPSRHAELVDAVEALE